MSMIAQKNTQQQKGPESIFIYMGLVFLLVDLLLLIMLILFSEINTNIMVPLIYFLMLSGIHFGMGTYMREHGYDAKSVKNWYIGLIFIGIIVGAILGAYMW